MIFHDLANPNLIPSRLSILIAVVVTTTACIHNTREQPLTNSTSNEITELSGESLAKEHCASCHVFPEPQLLDKETWRRGVLPQMGYRMGFYGDTTRQSLIETGSGGEIVKERGIFPSQPIIDEIEWDAIKKYYLSQAPDSLEIPDKSIQLGIPGSAVDIPEFRITPPMITLVRYHPELDQIYVADAKADYSTINILDSRLASISTLALPSPISDIAFRSDTLLVTLMGEFMPTDNPSGRIVKVFKKPMEKEYSGFTTVLDKLQRPVDVAYEDLNQDQLEDIVVCEYGNHTGKLSLFIHQESGQYNRKILSRDPGAISLEIRDLNQDELPDIVVLMAQGNERIDAYYNQGNGDFNMVSLLQFPPSYGSVDFSLIDWNKDGFEDIIYVNGDNADYSQIFKPYHGLRLFLNDGTNHFQEAFFQQLNGAYQAITQDFNRDGDLDIATVSFFPNLIRTSEEGFVLMENISTEDSLQFELRSFEQAATGRWIAMEAADLTGDGLPELILGAFTGMAIQGDTVGRLGTQLIENSPTILTLKLSM